MNSLSKSQVPIQAKQDQHLEKSETIPKFQQSSNLSIVAKKAVYGVATAFSNYAWFTYSKSQDLAQCAAKFAAVHAKGLKDPILGGSFCGREIQCIFGLNNQNSMNEVEIIAQAKASKIDCDAQAGSLATVFLINGAMNAFKQRVIFGSVEPTNIVRDWRVLEEKNGTVKTVEAVGRVGAPYLIPRAESLVWYVGSSVLLTPFKAAWSFGKNIWNGPSDKTAKEEPASQLKSSPYGGFLSSNFALQNLAEFGQTVIYTADAVVSGTVANFIPSHSEKIQMENGVETTESDRLDSSLSKEKEHDLKKSFTELALCASKFGGVAALALLPGPALTGFLEQMTWLTGINSLARYGFQLNSELSEKSSLENLENLEGYKAVCEKHLKKDSLSNEKRKGVEEIIAKTEVEILEKKKEYLQLKKKNEAYYKQTYQGGFEEGFKRDWKLLQEKKINLLGAAGYFGVEAVRNFMLPAQTAMGVVDTVYSRAKNTLCGSLSRGAVRTTVEITLPLMLMFWGYEKVSTMTKVTLGDRSIVQMMQSSFFPE